MLVASGVATRYPSRQLVLQPLRSKQADQASYHMLESLQRLHADDRLTFLQCRMAEGE
jgi:hypothetical protein